MSASKLSQRRNFVARPPGKPPPKPPTGELSAPPLLQPLLHPLPEADAARFPRPQVWALLEAGAITSAHIDDRLGHACVDVAPTEALRSLLAAASPMHWAVRGGLRFTVADLLKMPSLHSADHPDDVRWPPGRTDGQSAASSLPPRPAPRRA